MIRRPPRSTLSSSSAASDVYKRQVRERPQQIDDQGAPYEDDVDRKRYAYHQRQDGLVPASKQVPPLASYERQPVEREPIEPTATWRGFGSHPRQPGLAGLDGGGRSC